MFADDLEAAVARYTRAGFATALYAEMNDGFAFAMIDRLREMGHMVELYEALPSLTNFYEMVAKSADTFDGIDLIRRIAFD